MAYVTVPKDLAKVKNKVAFNLTKRQLICILIGGAIGIPIYFLTRDLIGTSNAATIMVLFMLPAFFFAMYEKDGMYLEQILMNRIRVRLLRPAIREYEMEHLVTEKKRGGGKFDKKKQRVSKRKNKGKKTGKKKAKKRKEKNICSKDDSISSDGEGWDLQSKRSYLF